MLRWALTRLLALLGVTGSRDGGWIYSGSPASAALRALILLFEVHLTFLCFFSSPLPCSFPACVQGEAGRNLGLQLVQALRWLWGDGRSGGNAGSTCPATGDWPGWAGIKYAFIFGDSYTQTGFNSSFEAPSPSNPLGNPVYPGWTSSNGPNWVDFLTVKHNASLLQTYNLAYGGATVSDVLVEPYHPSVLSLKDQVQTLFSEAYTSGSPAWSGSDSVFAIWIGINDIGNSYYRGPDATTTLDQKIMRVYAELVRELHTAGARNFVFLNVPPVDRSPLTMERGNGAQVMERRDILLFNALVADLATRLKMEKEVNVWIYDTYAAFTQVLDDPTSWPQTAGYKNVTSFCQEYSNGTPQWDSFYEVCGIAVDEYLWLNNLHPTYPIHDVVADGVARALKAGPNVCLGKEEDESTELRLRGR